MKAYLLPWQALAEELKMYLNSSGKGRHFLNEIKQSIAEVTSVNPATVSRILADLDVANIPGFWEDYCRAISTANLKIFVATLKYQLHQFLFAEENLKNAFRTIGYSDIYTKLLATENAEELLIRSYLVACFPVISRNHGNSPKVIKYHDDMLRDHSFVTMPIADLAKTNHGIKEPDHPRAADLFAYMIVKDEKEIVDLSLIHAYIKQNNDAYFKCITEAIKEYNDCNSSSCCSFLLSRLDPGLRRMHKLNTKLAAARKDPSKINELKQFVDDITSGKDYYSWHQPRADGLDNILKQFLEGYTRTKIEHIERKSEKSELQPPCSRSSL